MAIPLGVPVNVVSSGGIPVVQIAYDAAQSAQGPVFTVTTAPGMAVRLVSDLGISAILTDEAGDEYVP